MRMSEHKESQRKEVDSVGKVNVFTIKTAPKPIKVTVTAVRRAGKDKYSA